MIWYFWWSIMNIKRNKHKRENLEKIILFWSDTWSFLKRFCVQFSIFNRIHKENTNFKERDRARNVTTFHTFNFTTNPDFRHLVQWFISMLFNESFFKFLSIKSSILLWFPKQQEISFLHHLRLRFDLPLNIGMWKQWLLSDFMVSWIC